MEILSWLWMGAILVAGSWIVWQVGVKRESLMGAVFGMFLTIGGVVIAEPSVMRQLSVLMVGIAIGLLIVAFILMGWMWNVMAIAKWRRINVASRSGQGESVDEWVPWLAWYPVTTERGKAWMRFVQVRFLKVGAAQETRSVGLEFREVPSARAA